MAILELDAKLLSDMFCAGVRELEANKDWINELNVFPVPDGDTGTNMTLTLVSAVHEVKNLKDMSLPALGKAISSGSLRGARGNSGVILSQLCRGFTKVLKEADVLNEEILIRALNAATETAYKAVMKPKEGTILTVARGISEKAAELGEQEKDLAEILRQVQLRRWEGVEMYGGRLSGAGCGAAGLQIPGGAPEGTAGAHAV